MAGEKDKKDDNPFSGFQDHTDADNLANPADAPTTDDDTNDDDGDGDDGGNQRELDLGEADELEDTLADEDADEDDDGEDDGDDDGQDEGEGAGHIDDDDEDDDPEPAPKKKRSVGERIAEFRKRTGDAERRAERAETLFEEAQARLDAIEERLTGSPNRGSAENDETFGLVKPDPADLEKYPYGEMDTQYQSDLTDYTVDLKLAKRDAENETVQQTEAAARQAEELQATYKSRVEKGIQSYEDFEDVVVKAADERKFPLSKTVALLGLESDYGHHVLYKIATDLPLAKKIAKMSPANQGREFGRLEAQFARRATPKNKNKPNAGPPAPRRRSGKSGSTRTKGNTSDFAAFESQANADEARRNKR